MYVRLKYLLDIVTYIFNNYYSFLVFPRARYESRNGKRSNFCVENPHCKYFLYRKCQSVSQYHLFSDRCRVWSIAKCILYTLQSTGRSVTLQSSAS